MLIRTALRKRDSVIVPLPRSVSSRVSKRRAARALDESERRFALLFEHAAIGMCFVSLEGRFLQANGRLCDIVGYTPREMLEMTCSALTHADDRAAEAVSRARMVAGELASSAWEKRYVHKDGRPVWCAVTLTLIRNARGEPTQFVGFVEHIGDRKRESQLLEESESLLRLAGEAAHLGGWSFDINDHFFVLSDEVCSIFDMPRGWRPTFQEAKVFLLGDAFDRMRHASQRGHRSRTGFDIEVEIETHVGRRRWVRVIGQAARSRGRIMGALQDITDRKSVELEMMRMNRALKMLSGCNEVLVRATSEEQLLRDICALAVDVGGYAMAWVGFARDDAERSIELVGIAGHHDDYFGDLHLGWDANLPSGHCAAGMTIRTGDVVVVEDIERDTRFAKYRPAALERGYRSVVDLPLRAKGRIFGVLGLHAFDVRKPAKAELDLLQQMARDLAFGIEHLRVQVERQRIQDAVLKISSAVSARAGTEFLERLVVNMAEAVGAQAAFVIRQHPTDVAKLRTLVAVVDGTLLGNLDFTSDGSPCEAVGSDEVFIVEARLSERYPQCSVAASIGSQSVVGWRLCDSNGTMLATMMVFFREPIAELEFTTSTLKIFVARAAAELERQVADARIADQASWLDRARDAIVVRDIDGRISFWNKSAERLYGWRGDEVLGSTLGDAFFDDRERLKEATASVHALGFWNGEVEHRRKDGSLVWVESRWSLVSDDGGEARSILAIDTDITARNIAEREIEHLAFYDVLTNLPNRHCLVQRLKKAIDGGDGFGALLFLDLDNFKTLNDTLGHDMGDLLLQEVASRLQSCVRATDTVARLGGDEFVIMLESLGASFDSATKAAQRVATDILVASNAPYDLRGSAHNSTPSIGVTLFARGENTDDVLKQADLAMYQAKGAGRNAVRFFDPKMEAMAISRRALEDDIRAALRADEFHVVLQPQVDASGDVIGAEALVRWMHERRGAVAPNDFIPIAEESGLIVPLGRRVLELACLQLVSWSERSHTADLTLSINVSAREFRQADFVSHVVETLEAYGANPERLVLELTESVLVDDLDVVIAKMAALREIGIGFSLDDFGTGYSSLSYLKRLPLNQLKIDKSFVRDVFVDANDGVIARTIVALGRSLSLDVIAEGVETQEQRAFLIDAGCRSFQGYLFSRPLAASAFDAFVTERAFREARL